jgi:acyl-CoA synthetase (AMP-forming)/AMP-acid ligase II
VCVPLYPPSPRALRRWKEQALMIARVAQPCGAVVTGDAHLHLAAVLEQVAPDLFAVTPKRLGDTGRDRPATIDPARDLAFIQFTSGTTREPRGVSVTHAALMANIRALLEVMPLTASDVSVSWLPPYHDMGLVGHIFVPVVCGVHQHLMPPSLFSRRPERWLELISRARATQTTAPNFAYSMCARRVSARARRGLDLSSLRWVLNGAETVQAETLELFSRTFGPQGFDFRAFRPVYGLAEATLAATFSPEGGVDVDWVDRHELAAGCARRVSPDQPRAQAVVSVGRPLPGCGIRVVREGGGPCTMREVGEIWLQGPFVMQGYFNDPQRTREVLRDGWLRTGDIGYVDERGLLRVTGRIKELIIKSGCNYLPQDLEAACVDVPGVRPGRAVAFGLPSLTSGTELVVLVAEVGDPRRVDDPMLLERVARVVDARTGVRPDRVELLAPGVLPKTTSGKLRRRQVRQAYEAGRPLRPPRPAPVDLLREGVSSVLDVVAARVSRLMGWQ